MDFLDILFPRKCPVCGMVLKRGERQICISCCRNLPLVKEPRCMRCGKPVSLVEETYCFDCEKKKQEGQNVLMKGTALWVYDTHMRQAMANFKYEGCLEDGSFYVEELCKNRGDEIANWSVEAVIPVPLHWRKRWFRGYNQAEVLAEGLGEYLQLPVLGNVLKRSRYTIPQKGLAPKQRAQNLTGAFAVTKKGRERVSDIHRVLLVDDIYTTGATLEACAEVLRAEGVQEIFFACLCIGRDF